MCRPATCDICGKTTWAGCGLHIEEVRVQVPADQWCGGHGTTEQTTVKASSGLFRIVDR